MFGSKKISIHIAFLRFHKVSLSSVDGNFPQSKSIKRYETFK